MTREDVQKKWEARVATFRASGEKVTKWCKVNKVDRRQLYTWMKRLDGSSGNTVSRKPPSFINVALTPEAETKRLTSIHIKLGTAVIEVEPGFNPTLLREVVKALEVIC
ncbi:IS66 family insertion sequence element accessory protein TnpA [Paenibacillus chibensis]|uniref:IS66 family insertion sequence element accessory protein TnpA n=1 Tax=Paenibacillus chibensis TaxID=59846 RepID=UPI000FD6E13C|nr:IS630 transposase-related protein [Paenibacillus chibensis]MEC0371475.1 IS630 transposase-related protein [Paenibacillus chibensis]